VYPRDRASSPTRRSSELLDVVVVQAVPGIDDQPLGAAQAHTVADALQFPGLAGGVRGVGVAAGVQLDGRRADPARGADLAFLGRSEEHTSELQSRENLVC